MGARTRRGGAAVPPSRLCRRSSKARRGGAAAPPSRLCRRSSKACRSEQKNIAHCAL